LNKSYYHFKKDEYEAIKNVIKGDIHRIWSNELSEGNESLDNEDVFLNYF